MGGIIGGGGSGPSIERVAGIQVSSSGYGDVIPVVFGSVRLPMRLLDYDDFWSRENKQKAAGGKGGQEQTTGYSYFASVLALLCTPEIVGIGRAWVDKDVKDAEDLNLTVCTGSATQTPWPIWQTKHPDKALSYAGLAYVAGVDFALNSSGGMPNINVEVFGSHSGDSESGHAAPANIVTEILANPVYGIGFPASKVSDFSGASGYSEYCKAEGFWLSCLFDQQKDAAETLGDIMRATNSTMRWRSGSRKMILDVLPLGVVPVTANSASYTPNRRPVIDLYRSDLMGVFDDDGQPTGESGIEIERTPESETFNSVAVDFSDVLREYNKATMTASDDGDASDSGQRDGSSIDLPIIPTPEHASKIAQIEVAKSLSDRDKITAAFDIRFSTILEPGDLITYTDADFALDHAPMIIEEIGEPSQPSNIEGVYRLPGSRFVMRPYLGTVGATLYARDGSSAPGDVGEPGAGFAGAGGGAGGGGSPGQSVAPGDSHSPLIFEPPPALTGGRRQLWLATTGGEHWGGAQVHVSIDGGASYSRIGQVESRARYGATTAPTGGGAGDTVAVQLTGYQPDSLDGTSAQGLASAATASWLGGEVIAYRDTTLTGANAYALSVLRRGLFGTAAASHSAGADFARLDSAIFKYDIPDGLADGETIRVKLVSFNIFNAGLQNIANCTEYYYTISGQSWPAAGSVTLALSSTKPSTTAAHAYVSDGWSDGVLWDGGAVRYIMPVWCSVAWGWGGDDPVGGFEVLLHAGDNPADESTHVRAVQVGPACRLAVLAINPSSAVTLRASVRSINV